MLVIIFSYIADLIFGDPQWFPHPVKGMGKLINFFESKLNNSVAEKQKISSIRKRIKGVMLVGAVVGISTCLAYLFIKLSGEVNPFLGNLAGIYLGYTALSIRDLRVKAKKILRELEKGSLIKARVQLSEIVGRDTHSLDKRGIIAATVESIAESTNDGIIAPLFYLILGGPVLAIAYKSINTLDSMVGYKNDKYLLFGWFSAKLDDLVNFIPARISGFLIALTSVIAGGKIKESLIIMIRDGRKHSSPNSGVPEAAMAGALGVKLGGVSAYQGVVVAAPYLGVEKRALEPVFINQALTISLMVSIVMISAGVILKW